MEQVRLLSEPQPDAVFNALAVRPNRTASIAQLAAATGQSHTQVREHLLSLEGVDAVERVSAGDDATYRATADPLITDAEWAQLPVDVRRRSFAATLAGIERQIWSAHAAGGFDAPDAHASRVPADLDERGYRDVVALLTETLERAMAIQAEVVERRATGEADGDTVRTDVVLMHYRAPSGTDATTRPPDAIALRDDVCELSDDIADEVALDAADWQRVAAHAEALATLARRFAAAT